MPGRKPLRSTDGRRPSPPPRGKNTSKTKPFLGATIGGAHLERSRQRLEDSLKNKKTIIKSQKGSTASRRKRLMKKLNQGTTGGRTRNLSLRENPARKITRARPRSRRSA